MFRTLSCKKTAICTALTAALVAGTANATEWSVTEFHLQYGELDIPNFPTVNDPGGEEDTLILTLQNASGWKYGESFFFVDFLDGEDNDHSTHMEWYPTLSLGKLSGSQVGFGPVKDIGLIAGINLTPDVNERKYLPGVRFAIDAPGFTFLNLDVTAYIDDNEGAAAGGAPSEDDSFMVDVSWAYPFKVGNLSFSIEGHAEYIGERDNEFGDTVSDWILAQPQFRLDVGELLFGSADQLYAGIEYQYWMNKLGDSGSDESAVQALVVWRL